MPFTDARPENPALSPQSNSEPKSSRSGAARKGGFFASINRKTPASPGLADNVTATPCRTPREPESRSKPRARFLESNDRSKVIYTKGKPETQLEVPGGPPEQPMR